MEWQWLLIAVLCQTFINDITCKEIIAQVNPKRLIHYVPERFLSMTIDPGTILLAGKLGNEALSMARGLSPSFVRLGGKSTNYIKFGKELFMDNTTITEEQWDSVNQFAQESQMDLIASINPTDRINGVWDSRDALQLISYTDKQGYTVAWQLGYDTQGIQASGAEVGRDVVRLRKILDGFSKFSRSPIFGPDLSDVRDPKEAHFVRDLLNQAGPVLGAIFIEAPFTAEEDPAQTIVNTISNLDHYVWGKALRYGRMIPRKPIWIAEREISQGTAQDAINLAKRLGAAAKIGVQVLMRQVGPTTLKQPTPEFWVALIYKNLVGRGVLDAKINSGNSSHIHLYSHCAHSQPKEKSIIDEGLAYDKGAVTVFGVNEDPETVRIMLKAGMREEKVHAYTITFGENTNGQIEETFMNGQLLGLSQSGDLPILSPKIIKRPSKHGILIPGRSVFFFVLPDVKSRICSTNPVMNIEPHDLTKKLIQVASEVLDRPNGMFAKSDEEEDEGKVYVKFGKPIGTGMRTFQSLKQEMLQDVQTKEPEDQVKSTTLNDNFSGKVVDPINENKDGNIESDKEKSETVTEAMIATQNSTENKESTDHTEPSVKKENKDSEEKARRKRSLSNPTDMEVASSNSNPTVSQEELVNYFNSFARKVYEKSQCKKDGVNSDYEITTLPEPIFKAFQTARITFKNLNGSSLTPEESSANLNSDLENNEENGGDTSPTEGSEVNDDIGTDEAEDNNEAQGTNYGDTVNDLDSTTYVRDANNNIETTSNVETLSDIETPSHLGSSSDIKSSNGADTTTDVETSNNEETKNDEEATKYQENTNDDTSSDVNKQSIIENEENQDNLQRVPKAANFQEDLSKGSFRESNERNGFLTDESSNKQKVFQESDLGSENEDASESTSSTKDQPKERIPRDESIRESESLIEPSGGGGTDNEKASGVNEPGGESEDVNEPTKDVGNAEESENTVSNDIASSGPSNPAKVTSQDNRDATEKVDKLNIKSEPDAEYVMEDSPTSRLVALNSIKEGSKESKNILSEKLTETMDPEEVTIIEGVEPEKVDELLMKMAEGDGKEQYIETKKANKPTPPKIIMKKTKGIKENIELPPNEVKPNETPQLELQETPEETAKGKEVEEITDSQVNESEVNPEKSLQDGPEIQDLNTPNTVKVLRESPQSAYEITSRNDISTNPKNQPAMLLLDPKSELTEDEENELDYLNQIKSGQGDSDINYGTSTDTNNIDPADEKLNEPLTDENLNEALSDDNMNEPLINEKLNDASSGDKLTETSTSDELSQPLTESKLNGPMAEDKLSEALTEEKLNEATTDDKLSELTEGEKLNEGVEDEKFNEGVENEKLNEGIEDEKLNEGVEDEKLNEGLEDEKLNEEVEDEKLNEPVVDEKIVEPSSSDKIMEPSADDEFTVLMPDDKVNEPPTNGKLNEPSAGYKVTEPSEYILRGLTSEGKSNRLTTAEQLNESKNDDLNAPCIGDKFCGELRTDENSNKVSEIQQLPVVSFKDVPLDRTQDKTYNPVRRSPENFVEEVNENAEEADNENQAAVEEEENNENGDIETPEQALESEKLVENKPAMLSLPMDSLEESVSSSVTSAQSSELPVSDTESSKMDVEEVQKSADEDASAKTEELSKKQGVIKAALESERLKKLQAIRSKIMEARNKFFATVKEDGLKAALQQREELMRSLLSPENDPKSKFFSLPYVSPDRALSRPRRLTYYPEDENSGDMYDYPVYKRSDSYGLPLSDDYEKDYLNQELASTLSSPDRNHVIFPLDPKTTQAVVYNNKIIPAKLYGVISINDDLSPKMPSGSPKVELPSEAFFQKYYNKPCESTVYKDKYIPSMSDIPSIKPLSNYGIPRDAYVKRSPDPDFIPVVVLSPKSTLRRKRSLPEFKLQKKLEPLQKKLELSDGMKKHDFHKRSITSTEINNLDIANEITKDKHHSIISNEIKPDHYESFKHSKDFSGYPSMNGINYDYVNYNGNPDYISSQFWPVNSHPKDISEARTIPGLGLPPLPGLLPSQPFPPPPPLFPPAHPLPLPPASRILPESESHSSYSLDPPREKHLPEPPQVYFFQMLQDKFKSLIGMLESLSDWCGGSGR